LFDSRTTVKSHPMTFYLVPSIGAGTVWETVPEPCQLFCDVRKKNSDKVY